MAYNDNGKVYTDSSLMDEIVFDCKKILNNIVVKNDVMANINETENSLKYAEVYFIQHEGRDAPLGTFPLNRQLLADYGYNENEIVAILANVSNVDEEDWDSLEAFANEWFAENFEEENDYYRILIGLPPYNTGEVYYVYITESDFPSLYKKTIDYSVPLHEQPNDIISILYNTGSMDKIIERNPGIRYSYLRFLGPRRLDLYTVRKASKWDILYMPSVNNLVKNKFEEFYIINKELYSVQSYQEVYSDTGDYYDQLMIIMLLAQTFTDMIVDVPEWYIRRDIFDIRSVKYFLESYGVEFFKEIPLRYQTKIVKNVNKLIKFKSSNINLEDIIDVIITTDNIKIIKYWMFKKRNIGKDGSFIPLDDDENDPFDLEFISSGNMESYDKYIKDPIYRTPYDDLTYYDKYWDGEDDHSYVKDQITNKDFTIEGTKYMSIEYKVNLSEYLFEVEYFLGLILDSKVNLDDIRINVSGIDNSVDFSLSNLFLYLCILSDCYYRLDANDGALDIRRPDTSEGEIPTAWEDPDDEYHFNWMKKWSPEVFQVKNGRVHAFNSEYDYDEMYKYYVKRHAHYIWGSSQENVDYDNPGADTPLTKEEYAAKVEADFEGLGIEGYINPASVEYKSVADVIEVYRNNRQCYENLIEKIRKADDMDDLEGLSYIYQELFTRSFDSDFYTLSTGFPAKNLIEILMDRDYILYNHYIMVMSENNIETRKDQIRGLLNDIVETLEYYISGDGLEYLFGFTPTDSFFNIVYYIWLLIGFFKSFKVQFLDPYVTFVTDNKMDPLDSYIRAKDSITEWKETRWKQDRSSIMDNIAFNMEIDWNDQNKIDRESMDFYAHSEFDPLEDFDYDGLEALTGEEPNWKDLNGGVSDPNLNIPYYEVDAGTAYLGMKNVNDIDGYYAKESENVFEKYRDIDGGPAYIEADKKKDWSGSQGFNYYLDGGAASPYYFKSRTIEINISGGYISLDAIVSSKDTNNIIVLDDGLYVADFLVDASDYKLIMKEITELINAITVGGTDAITEIMSVDSLDTVYKRIASCINSILYNMESSTTDILDDELMNRVTSFVDTEVSYITNMFVSENPYGWEEL